MQDREALKIEAKVYDKAKLVMNSIPRQSSIFKEELRPDKGVSDHTTMQPPDESEPDNSSNNKGQPDKQTMSQSQ